jgi:rSAM/selenodomain-associated transferase 1
LSRSRRSKIPASRPAPSNFGYNQRDAIQSKDCPTANIFGMNTSYPILDPHAPETHRTRGRCALGVMIKAPRAGASKTRLVPPLTHEEAARLSVAFLRDTAANMADACAEDSDGEVQAVAVYTPAGAEDEFDKLLPPTFALLAQRGDTFGARLFNAASDLLRLGYESCCLIDSDSPTLPRALLTAALAELRRPGDRLVLGPADDGGYYLIGMKRAHPRLFEEIAWSTADVLAQTVERARELNLDVGLLPAWYDVDDAATLRRLCVELFDAPDSDGDAAVCKTKLAPYSSPHTRAELTRLLEGEGRVRLLAEAAAREGNVA